MSIFFVRSRVPIAPSFFDTMFSTAVHAALIALTATATVVSAVPALSLKVTGPTAVDGVENLKVVTTLTNIGDETLKLLNDPRGALHVLPANTFDITTDNGDSPDFTGVRVKYSLIEAAKSTDPSAFTVLAPGQSLSLTHDRKFLYCRCRCVELWLMFIIRSLIGIQLYKYRTQQLHCRGIQPLPFRQWRQRSSRDPRRCRVACRCLG